MRKLVLFGVLVLLIACQKDVPAKEEITVLTPVITTAVPATIPPDLPAPAVEETVLESTAVPPTVTPSDPNSISSIIAQVETLSAKFELANPYRTGWFYHREESYERPQDGIIPATYRGLADSWLIEVWTEVGQEDTIAQQVLLVYDTEGGLWERSAIIENTNVRVLPEQTVDGRVIALDEPLLFQTPHQSLINILREIESASFFDHTVTAWEENGRYHIQIDTLYNSTVPAEENTTGKSLNGEKIQFVLDMNTGELLQQRNWTINGTGEETLLLDVTWLETAVVPELPFLAAQTLTDAAVLLASSGN